MAGTRVSSLCIAICVARSGYYGRKLCRARRESVSHVKLARNVRNCGVFYVESGPFPSLGPQIGLCKWVGDGTLRGGFIGKNAGQYSDRKFSIVLTSAEVIG